MREYNLGPCCGCQRTDGVRNILMLDKKAPVSGKGWGCFQCHAPAQGAYAVVCDECLEKLNGAKDEDVLQFACGGTPTESNRVPIGDLTEPFGHDLFFHPELSEEEKAKYA